MNDERRKRIARIKLAVEGVRAELDEIAREERDAFDEIPDNLKDGERGQKVEASAKVLWNARTTCDAITGYLDTAAAE